MSMEIETRMSDQIARYLDLATAEAKLTAANMANSTRPATGRWAWTSRQRCARLSVMWSEARRREGCG